MRRLPPVKVDVAAVLAYSTALLPSALDWRTRRRCMLGSSGWGCCHLKIGLGGPAALHAVTLERGIGRPSGFRVRFPYLRCGCRRGSV